jgi:dihydroxy-acid dehydratase
MAAGIAEQKATHEDLAAHLQPAAGKSDLISVFKGVGELKTGKITEEQLKKLEQTACPTCGSCSGMFTANSMNCLCEALGIALPGNGTILAVSKEREALYDRAARAIVKLVEHDITPRAIATLEAFDNALMLDVAMGGSTNTILHTLAIAREAGIPYDIARIDAISRRIPFLCKVSPSSNYHVQDVHRAGGIHHPWRAEAHGRPEHLLRHRHRQDHRREHRGMGHPLGTLYRLGRTARVSAPPRSW